MTPRIDGAAPAPRQKRNKREIITREAEAIELGLHALGYMLHRTAEMAVDLNLIGGDSRNSLKGKQQANRLSTDNLKLLRKARKVLGRLMEDVGNFRDGTDSCTDNEGDITEPAFKAMHELEGKGHLHAE